MSLLTWASPKRLLGIWNEALTFDELALAGYAHLYGDRHEKTLKARISCVMDLGALSRFSDVAELLPQLDADARNALTRKNPLRRQIILAITTLRATLKMFEGEEGN